MYCRKREFSPFNYSSKSEKMEMEWETKRTDQKYMYMANTRSRARVYSAFSKHTQKKRVFSCSCWKWREARDKPIPITIFQRNEKKMSSATFCESTEASGPTFLGGFMYEYDYMSILDWIQSGNKKKKRRYFDRIWTSAKKEFEIYRWMGTGGDFCWWWGEQRLILYNENYLSENGKMNTCDHAS